MNFLFVGGPPRSGTTAFTEYLDEHPEILVCRERFKWRPRRQVTPKLFDFDTIANFEDGYEKRDTERRRAVHEELLSRKNPNQLKWIGDKFPGYVRTLDTLEQNNPGSKFILMYRSIEEVAESFEARSKNPDDPWLGGKDGFAEGVSFWNKAMRATKDYIETTGGANVLIIAYNDFFRNNADCIPLLSRFLDLEFDEEVRRRWASKSLQFENKRREKEPPDERQRNLIEEEADRDAEAYVLERIEKQWERLNIASDELKDAAEGYAQESRRLANAERRIGELEVRLQTERQRLKSAKARNRRLNGEAKKAERELEAVYASNTWKVVQATARVRGGLVRLAQGSSNSAKDNEEVSQLKGHLEQARKELDEKDRRIATLEKAPDPPRAIEYEGHFLPPANMRPNGPKKRNSDEVYLESARWEIDWMSKHISLSSESNLLDIGCGSGRIAIGIIDRIGELQSYVGIDANERFIRWAQRHISKAHPSFQFVHLDVKNDYYNPGGQEIADDFALPFSSGEFDIVCLFSVFTHMLTEDVSKYLGELHRVLQDDGKVFLTANLEDDVPDVEENPIGYRGKTEYKNPLATVRYNREFFESLLAKGGFRLEKYDPTVRKPQRCLIVSKDS